MGSLLSSDGSLGGSIDSAEEDAVFASERTIRIRRISAPAIVNPYRYGTLELEIGTGGRERIHGDLPSPKVLGSV